MNWVFKAIGIGMTWMGIRNNLIWFSSNRSGKSFEIPGSFPAGLLISDHYTCADMRALFLSRTYTYPVPETDRCRISRTGMIWSIGAVVVMAIQLFSGVSSQISGLVLIIAWAEFGTILSALEKRSWMRIDLYHYTMVSGVILTTMFTLIVIWMMASGNNTQLYIPGICS